MPTATRAEYLTLGGLLLATRAISGHDYDDLLQSPGKRGSDVPIPGQGGESARDRVAGSLRGLVHVRIDGRFDHDTDATTADAREGAFAAYALLHAKAEVTTVQTLQLVRPAGTVSADCQVEDLLKIGQQTPWIWDCVLDVKLAVGSLL